MEGVKNPEVQPRKTSWRRERNVGTRNSGTREASSRQWSTLTVAPGIRHQAKSERRPSASTKLSQKVSDDTGPEGPITFVQSATTAAAQALLGD
jgi:hypothetical protein